MMVPVEKGKRYSIKISAETGHNEGIGKIENFPIYIKNAKKNEELKIEITDIKKHYAIGVIR